MSAPVFVARISKLFGHEGEVVLNLYDTFPEDPDNEEPLLARIDSLTDPLFFDEFRRRGRTSAVVRFADFDTPDRASQLLGLELFIDDEGDGDEDEDPGDGVFLEDLVGYSALFLGNETLSGTIDGFIDSEHNPLFSINIDGKEVFVPAADDLIAGFDTLARTVTFDLPEGLLDLYL